MTLILVYNIIESLISIFASVFDITTDLRNSMDFLRYNVTNGSNQGNGIIERSDPLWTGIGIGIVFSTLWKGENIECLQLQFRAVLSSGARI